MAPEGAPLDIERFFDVASPEGVAVPFEMAWPGDVTVRQVPQMPRNGEPGPEAARDPARLPATREGALEPPEYLSLIGGAPERLLLEAPPPEEQSPSERPLPPDPPGFAQPQAPQGKEPRAPGQAACTQNAYYVFPPVEQFLFTPEPPEMRGQGGGGDDDPKPQYVDAFWVDPCPCVCYCVHFSWIVNVFVRARKLLGSFFDLFGKDTRSLLGVSVRPEVVIATPDGFVEQVRDLLVRRDTVAYGTPGSMAPGGAAPADGLSATFSARARGMPATTPRLLWPELDGSLASEIRVVAPVGPGPGLPGIGAQPLVPASGSTLRAAPGSLHAGIAPAGDGFGPGLRGGVAP